MDLIRDLIKVFLLLFDSIGTFIISLFLPSQKKCFDFHTVPQIIELNGYSCSTHTVTTGDGFLLTLFRISSKQNQQNGVHSNKNSIKKPVALLWHGLMDSSYTWIYPGKKSLAYELCDKGFDVWLGNNRGTKYSVKHSFLKRSEDDMWRFSYDEFVKYDLPNSIDYILSETNSSNLSYIGHSQGTTQMFGLLSCNPEYGTKLCSFTGLGPAASVQHCRGFLKQLAIIRLDQFFWWLQFRKQFMPAPESLLRQSLSLICWLFPWFADDVLRMMCGKSSTKLPRSKVTEWVEHEPSGTSVMNLIHWAQLIRPCTGKDKNLSPFRLFDFGKEENIVRYRQETPPAYPLNQFPSDLPVLLFSGLNDTLADPKDVEWLTTQLQHASITVTKINSFNHTDYLWSSEAPTLVFNPTIEFVSSQIPLIQEKEKQLFESDIVLQEYPAPEKKETKKK